MALRSSGLHLSRCFFCFYLSHPLNFCLAWSRSPPCLEFRLHFLDLLPYPSHLTLAPRPLFLRSAGTYCLLPLLLRYAAGLVLPPTGFPFCSAFLTYFSSSSHFAGVFPSTAGCRLLTHPCTWVPTETPLFLCGKFILFSRFSFLPAAQLGLTFCFLFVTCSFLLNTYISFSSFCLPHSVDVWWVCSPHTQQRANLMAAGYISLIFLSSQAVLTFWTTVFMIHFISLNICLPRRSPWSNDTCRPPELTLTEQRYEWLRWCRLWVESAPLPRSLLHYSWFSRCVSGLYSRGSGGDHRLPCWRYSVHIGLFPSQSSTFTCPFPLRTSATSPAFCLPLSYWAVLGFWPYLSVFKVSLVGLTFRYSSFFREHHLLGVDSG